MACVAVKAEMVLKEKLENKKNRDELLELARLVEKWLLKRRMCGRCSTPFTYADSLGILGCAYGKKEEELISIDHATPGQDESRLYALFPAQLWTELRVAKMKHSGRTRFLHSYTKSRRPWLNGDAQVYAMDNAEDVSTKSFRLHLYGSDNKSSDPPIVEYRMIDLYDECARLYGYSPLHVQPQRMKEESTRPIGDSPGNFSALQRMMFDMEVVEDVCNETPDFVPCVIVFRVELRNLEIV